jgi:hypothetical protein
MANNSAYQWTSGGGLGNSTPVPSYQAAAARNFINVCWFEDVIYLLLFRACLRILVIFFFFFFPFFRMMYCFIFFSFFFLSLSLGYFLFLYSLFCGLPSLIC